MARAAFEDNCGPWTGIGRKPFPQTGNSLPNIWKLATKLKPHGIFVTEVPAAEEQAHLYEASWKGIAKQNPFRVPAKLLGQAGNR